MATQFILYSRGYCHLCDDMRVAMEHINGQRDFAVEIVDIDEDVALLKKYDELVPVLMGRCADGTLQEICRYFFDRVAVLAFFARSIEKISNL